jgi:hypothetical protein
MANAAARIRAASKFLSLPARSALRLPPGPGPGPGPAEAAAAAGGASSLAAAALSQATRNFKLTETRTRDSRPSQRVPGPPATRRLGNP